MSDKEKITKLQMLAWFLVILGFLIIAILLFRLDSSHTILGKVNLTDSGQFGDYVGGVVGAIWALAGIIFFYEALAVQQRELKLYGDELVNQRQEFAASRVVTVIYKQAASCDSKLQNLSLGKLSGDSAINRLFYLEEVFYSNRTESSTFDDQVINFIQSQELKTYQNHLITSFRLFEELIQQKDEPTKTENAKHLFSDITKVQLNTLVNSVFDSQTVFNFHASMKAAVEAYYGQKFSSGHNLYASSESIEGKKNKDLRRLGKFTNEFTNLVRLRAQP